MNNIKKEFTSLLFFVGIIILSIFIVFLFSFIDKWYIFLFSYIGLCVITHLLHRKWPNKLFRTMDNKVNAPLGVLYILLTLSLPVITLAIHLLLYLIIAYIPTMIVILLNRHFSFFEISNALLLFISFSSISVFAVSFYKYIIRLVYWISPVRINSSQKMKKYKIKEFTEYVLSARNIRFAIYFLYFIFLIPFSIQSINGNTLFASTSLDYATLQAFIVFIAFDSIRVNSRDIKMSFTGLLSKSLQGLFNNNFSENKDPE